MKSLSLPLKGLAWPTKPATAPHVRAAKPGRSWTPVLVFSALALIWYWGHHTAWMFVSTPLAGAGQQDSHSRTAATLAAQQSAGGRTTDPASIHLASAEMVNQLGIELAGAQRQPLCRELEVAARVSYEQTRVAQLTSRVAGSVWRVEKRVGEPIRRGEVLAIIDSLQVGKAKADLLQALAACDLKRKLAKRIGPGAASVLPYRQIEEIQADLRRAQFEVFNAQQTLINLGLEVDLEKLAGLADEELVRHVRFLGLPDAVVSELNPQIATANLLPLVAPFDGVVIGQDIVNGEVVSTLEKGFEIADVSHMLLKLSVREEESSQLRLGQTVTFQVGDRELVTAITWISTEVDRKTRTVEVRCDTPNPPAENAVGQYLLKANMFLTARIRVEQKAQALVVPTRAVQWSHGVPVVFVQIDPSSFEVRNVGLGIETDDLTEIVDGLDAGDVVATAGSHMLKCEASRSRLPGA